ncbi:hypothetical protein Tco_1030905, partial [Tanacetum coccineum]
MPPKSDLSFIGLDEFVNKPVLENIKSNEEVSKVVRKSDDSPIIKDWMSDNEEEDVSQPKIEKKTIRPSIVKKEFVKSKQQDKTARKTVKQVEQHRQNTHIPRGNQRNWNNTMSKKRGSNFEMFNKACYVCGSFDHLQVDCNYHQKLLGFFAKLVCSTGMYLFVVLLDGTLAQSRKTLEFLECLRAMVHKSRRWRGGRGRGKSRGLWKWQMQWCGSGGVANFPIGVACSRVFTSCDDLRLIAIGGDYQKARQSVAERTRNTQISNSISPNNILSDAKKLLEAIEKRFGGNASTKKTQRNLLKQQYENFTAPSSKMLDQTFDRLQKLVSQLELLDEKLSQEDVNQKLSKSLSPEWNTHVVVWRNKADLDTMSMDD